MEICAAVCETHIIKDLLVKTVLCTNNVIVIVLILICSISIQYRYVLGSILVLLEESHFASFSPFEQRQ